MRIGRYEIHREIARGGMATVHLGRLISDYGVGRVVAVKRLHPHCSGDSEFVSMFLDEARLATRIRHPNVVQVFDLVASDDQLYMILEYVEGETLANLASVAQGGKTGVPCPRIPDRIVAAVMVGALRGLHAAHEARSETGAPLGIVHRDFTPQNVLVGVDGVPRVADFGVAKAVVRLQTTREGQLKGKLGYMAPELLGPAAGSDRRTDIFSAGAVLWELLARQRLFQGENEAQIVVKILTGAVSAPSERVPGLNAAWDAIAQRALALVPERRYATASAMADAIEATFPCASAQEVGAWVSATAAAALHRRARAVAEMERLPQSDDASTPGAARLSPPPSGGAPAPAVTTDSTPPLPRRKREKAFGIAVLVVVAVGVAAVFRGAAPNVTTSAQAPADEVVGAAQGEVASEPSAPATLAASAAPSTSLAPASAAPASAAPASVGSPARRAPGPPRARASGRPAADATSKGNCRYFDEQEQIWKFRVECYR